MVGLTGRGRRDTGMVTAETAVIVPVCVLLVVLAVWIVLLGVTQVRLVDAARDLARLVARGVPAAAAEAAVRPSAPSHAHFTVRRDGEFIVVEARRLNHSPVPGLQWPLRAEAACVAER